MTGYRQRGGGAGDALLGSYGKQHMTVTDLRVSSLGGVFGAEVTNLNLADGFEDVLIDRLTSLVYEHKVLCLRDQPLMPQQLAAFGKAVGHPIEHVEENLRLGEDSTIMSLSNVDGRDARQRNGGAFWHTDLIFTEEPASLTMLNAVVVPLDGGPTRFADQAAAYDALDERRQRLLEDRMVHHCYEGRRDDSMPVVKHPLVRKHPVTARKALYGVAGTCLDIIGLSSHDSAKLLKELELHATSPQFVYTHYYRPNDLIIWDNAATLHCGPTLEEAAGDAAEEARVMHRCSVRGWRKPAEYST